MAQTLPELELNWEKDHRKLEALVAQVAAIAADNAALRLRVTTLEQQAALQTNAVVEELKRGNDIANQFGSKFFRVESQQAIVKNQPEDLKWVENL